MAKPIELMPKPTGQGAREELQRRLDAAPVEHAEAVLAGYELLQELHESGTLDVLRGLLGAGDQVVRHAVALAIQPEAVNGLRNLLVLSKVLGSVNPDVLHRAFSGCARRIGCTAGGGSAVALRALSAHVFGGEPPRFSSRCYGARKRGQGTGRRPKIDPGTIRLCGSSSPPFPSTRARSARAASRFPPVHLSGDSQSGSAAPARPRCPSRAAAGAPW